MPGGPRPANRAEGSLGSEQESGHRSHIGARRRFGVIVVDPLPVVRAGTSLLIGDRPDMEVLAEAGTADEGLAAIRRTRRSRVVVLIGLSLTGEHDAFWLIRTTRERFPSHALIACGANADPTMISRALFVGADGFVDKNIDPVEFLQALRRAADGRWSWPAPPVRRWERSPKGSSATGTPSEAHRA